MGFDIPRHVVEADGWPQFEGLVAGSWMIAIQVFAIGSGEGLLQVVLFSLCSSLCTQGQPSGKIETQPLLKDGSSWLFIFHVFFARMAYDMRLSSLDASILKRCCWVTRNVPTSQSGAWARKASGYGYCSSSHCTWLCWENSLGVRLLVVFQELVALFLFPGKQSCHLPINHEAKPSQCHSPFGRCSSRNSR